MSPPSEPDPTIAYHEEHADRFVAETRHVDMGDLYAPFLALIPPGGRILDTGCGSGRDAKAFLDMSYDVVAVDASPTMATAASRVIGQEVRVLRLQDLGYEGEFDGV